MVGENFVSLQGTLQWPELKTVGTNNSKLFKAKLVIPVAGTEDRKQYLKVAAWNDIAIGLSEVPQNAFVKLHGHIEERSYDGKCKACNAPEKKYWTEVVVDNYMLVTEDNSNG